MTIHEQTQILGTMAAARRADLEAATLNLVRHVGGGRALMAALAEAKNRRATVARRKAAKVSGAAR